MNRILRSIVVLIGTISVFLGLALPFYHFEITTIGNGGANYSIFYPESSSGLSTFGLIVAVFAVLTFLMSFTGKKILTLIPGIITSAMMIYYFIHETIEKSERIELINQMPNMSWTKSSGYYMCIISAIIMLLCVVTYFVMIGPVRKNTDIIENSNISAYEETGINTNTDANDDIS